MAHKSTALVPCGAIEEAYKSACASATPVVYSDGYGGIYSRNPRQEAQEEAKRWMDASKRNQEAFEQGQKRICASQRFAR